MEFTVPWKLNNGEVIEVLASVQGDVMRLGFSTVASDSPETIARCALEYYAISDHAWILYEDRVSEQIEQRKNEGISGSREAS